MQEQLTQSAKDALTKQAYRIIGSHSAVKTCHWTKSMIRGNGGCYKLTFYGIMSNQCMQMSTSISCANRCSFCWRDYKSPVSKDWRWKVDEPNVIFEESKQNHEKLLVGFKGNEKRNKGAYLGSKNIKHVALSLTGEPIAYPRMNELLDLFNKDGVSTFIVTNAQFPDEIKNLEPITQLYISLDAPNKSLLKTVDLPLFSDYWERLNSSLDHLAKKPERTTIRLTLVKGINDKDMEDYATLIKKGDPDFIEIKAYMHVGASMQRLNRDNMPTHGEVVDKTKELAKFLEDYELVSEHISSRVVMMAKKKFKIKGEWHTWIDFPKFQELAIAKKPFTAMDYTKLTPKRWIGIKGTYEETEFISQ
jgi:tRNA wybutosine-synthesizing protein 1